MIFAGDCPECGLSKEFSAIWTEIVHMGVTEFRGFECPCGHRFWHAGPSSPELTSTQWSASKARFAFDRAYSII